MRTGGGNLFCLCMHERYLYCQGFFTSGRREFFVLHLGLFPASQVLNTALHFLKSVVPSHLITSPIAYMAMADSDSDVRRRAVELIRNMDSKNLLPGWLLGRKFFFDLKKLGIFFDGI